MRFEWDENKRRSNFVKHGVDCADAAEIFKGDWVEEIDSDFLSFEERWKATGLSPMGVLMVVYVEQKETRRIISARRATKHEKARYYSRYA